VVDGDCMNRDVPGSGGMEIGTVRGQFRARGEMRKNLGCEEWRKWSTETVREKQGEDERSCSCQPCGVLFV